MKSWIVILAVLNILFFFMHEFDACFRGEWKMLKFLSGFSDKTQYMIFLYSHIPMTLFAFYYLWTVISFNNMFLWIAVNVFGVFHLIIHIIAVKWKTNVFKNVHSFAFIVGGAITGAVSLLLINYY